MPYDHGLIFQDGRPLIYDSGDFPASLDKLKKLVGWDDFEAYRAQARSEGRRVGIGLACYVEGTGVGPYEGGHVRVETDGTVVVSTGLTTQGQGHQTMLAQIVADELGVPFDRIRVTTGDTRRFKYAVGTFASRTAVMSGNAVALTARKVREKALRIAAQALEASVDDLDIVDGHVEVKGSPGATIDLGAVAVLSNPLRYAFDEAAARATQFATPADPDTPPVAPGEAPGLEGTDFYSPPRSTFANGMHAVVVETDPDTAEIKILRYCVVHDCGTIINPMIVEGQMHGGVAQGVGGALYERMVYDDDGQLLNASFMDFLMPYASEVPEIEIDHLETPSPLNPLGRQGRGRGGRDPRLGRDRLGHRGRRGDPDPEHADLPERAVRPALPAVRSDAARRPGVGCRRTGRRWAILAIEAHRAESLVSGHHERGRRSCGGTMKVSGSTTLQAPRHEVWRALNDPGVLVQTIPGCQRLEALGQYSYKMTVSAGVGSIKGVYDGEVHLTEHQEPGSFLMRAQGAGAPGTIGAAVQVTLVESAEGGTELTYDADATVGGMIGGVGQRMLTGVSKKLAAEFFDNVDALLAAGVAAGVAVARPGCRGRATPAKAGRPDHPASLRSASRQSRPRSPRLRRVSPSAAPPRLARRSPRPRLRLVSRSVAELRAGGDRVHAACGCGFGRGSCGGAGVRGGGRGRGGGGARGRGRRRVAHGAEA